MKTEIMYSANTPENFKYRVVLWANPPLPPGFWYVHNTKTGKFRKIGKVGAKRSNYYDLAIQFCFDNQL